MPVSPSEWGQKSSKPYHLTLQDIINIPKGTSKTIFFLDRNMFDLSCDEQYNPVNTPIKPSQFFRHGYYILFNKTDDGIKGNWTWLGAWVDQKTQPEIHREFDINYEHKRWYPLTDGKLLNTGDFHSRHYTSFPLSTKLGWRGEMMFQENMDKCPDIIYN